MSLYDTVQNELKMAMLQREQERVNALRLIRAAFIELQKEGTGEVTDERCIEALRRLKKQREDSIEAFRAGGRDDLVMIETMELHLIESFLPQLADEETTRAWVREAIQQTGATSPKEVGKVMGALMKAHKADVDGTLARRLIEAELGGGTAA